ncbi:glycine-rich domain-containing protein [Myroides odoratimimus]|uniref:TIGR04222 domain-containing membrane protein n=1 Tax=Myroides odoratimimus TaxID=76832 RepID=A0AAI8C4E8_9FLAO|nr:glycine-rich domain-containing protein-like [Myroides odoratimimus]ALU25944.1 hypothetical protein AS202_07220 [Myroides odoratimimus]EHO14435.1 hypothetical protein HMPREF9714_00453 [Myroides odoratimimus CCUG 12901]MDM1033113.1 glycine-rich domain-containing protein-like [Myroides odoratimimus]MDM1038733.1 glycine-rich domain-containing protein-like [Myroides odoratimimus]MDM1052825.1 glycine-rich domain-containing protein-like [Myroides odoratimimus]
MNKELWAKIEAFQLDKWTDEYGFVLRLAKENLWTKHFTESAILEYKKFMYLAATSNQMVSPSDIVDIVWHQHLIFTQSYNRFCKLLGKDIQHIPSTHNRTEIDKFREAKEQTTTLYTKAFGEQPKEIWEYRTMYDSLRLKKSKLSDNGLLGTSLVLVIALSIILFYPLRAIYREISSEVFLPFCIIIFIGLYIFMVRHSKTRIQEIITDSSYESFIFNLHPYEVLYLKNRGVSEGVIGTFHELIEQKNLKLDPKGRIRLIQSRIVKNREQAAVLKGIEETDIRDYEDLVNMLKTKPVFMNNKIVIDALFSYIRNSNKINQLIIQLLVTLGGMSFLAFMRIVIGISRDKPVFLISILTIVMVVTTIATISAVSSSLIEKGVLAYYQSRIIPKKAKENNWQWSYVEGGMAALGAALTTTVILSNSKHNNVFDSSNSWGTDSSSSSSSSDNSCSSDSGSSCGSSCGGCGGGGD